MIDVKKVQISIEANEKWLRQAVRHLKLEQINNVFTGNIPAKKGRSDFQLNVEVQKTRAGVIYKLEIIGSFRTWYTGARKRNLTKPMILECIDLLSQRLSLKKDIILRAQLLEYDFTPAVSGTSSIEIKTLSDFLLQWNNLTRFWGHKICRQSPESEHNRIQRKASRLQCKLTFEEENELYLKKLTCGQAVSFYIYWKLPEITGCYSEYSLALKKVKTERAKRQIQYCLRKMKPLLRELNKRSEAQEFEAEMEQELLELAMYG